MPPSLGATMCHIAAAEVGVSEHPPGSNRGDRVQQYQASTTLGGTGWPYCAAGCSWTWQRAGLPADLIHRICTASTDLNCSRARSEGLLVSPRPGAAIVWCGTHQGILYAPLSEMVWRTVEFNTSDGVDFRTRSLAGALIYAPPGLGSEPSFTDPEKLFWLEDPRADYEVKGPWSHRRMALSVYDGLLPSVRRRSKVVRTGDDKWAIRIGQARHIGPWIGPEGKDIRKRVKPILEERRNRRLREYSTTRMPRVTTAEALGKTT